jgi:hypothetical protein
LPITLSGLDPDGDPLTYQLLTQPLFGQLGGAAPFLAYVPQTNYFGFDQFTFVVNDHTTNSPAATVFLSVTPVEDRPGATLGLQPGQRQRPGPAQFPR